MPARLVTRLSIDSLLHSQITLAAGQRPYIIQTLQAGAWQVLAMYIAESICLHLRASAAIGYIV